MNSDYYYVAVLYWLRVANKRKSGTLKSRAMTMMNRVRVVR